MVMMKLGGSGFEIDRVDQLGHGEVKELVLRVLNLIMVKLRD